MYYLLQSFSTFSDEIYRFVVYSIPYVDIYNSNSDTRMYIVNPLKTFNSNHRNKVYCLCTSVLLQTVVFVAINKRIKRKEEREKNDKKDTGL